MPCPYEFVAMPERTDRKAEGKLQIAKGKRQKAQGKGQGQRAKGKTKKGRARHHREGLARMPAPDAPDLAAAGRLIGHRQQSFREIETR
jgi:hypothetical protein